MKPAPAIWLASTSPRRRDLLRQAGIEFEVIEPDVDDGRLSPSGSAARWAIAMAWLKGRRAAEMLAARGERDGIVIAADTVCSAAGRIIGQPRDGADARAMLRSMRAARHEVISGVCLIELDGGARRLFADRAVVEVGPLSDEQIDRYVESGQWRGKAGGYNLAERLEAGWPLRCDGDPATVMGLPVARLMPLLRRVIASAPGGAETRR